MSREVLVIRRCDNHDPPVEAASTRTVRLDGGRTLTVDACPDCEATIIGPFAAFVEAFGFVDEEPQSPRPKRAKDLTSNTACPVCGFVSRSRGALGQHLSTKHSKGLKDFPELRLT